MPTPRTIRRRLPSPRLAALAAVLAWAALAPGVARGASCGRHVALRLDASLTELAVLAAASAEAVDRPADAPAPPKPCDGPSCSGRPALPVAPGAIDPAQVKIDRWSSLVDPSAVEPPGGSALGVDGARPRPIHRSLSLDRPPKPSPSRSA